MEVFAWATVPYLGLLISGGQRKPCGASTCGAMAFPGKVRGSKVNSGQSTCAGGCIGKWTLTSPNQFLCIKSFRLGKKEVIVKFIEMCLEPTMLRKTSWEPL